MGLIFSIVIGIVGVVVGALIGRILEGLDERIKILEQKSDLYSSLVEKIQALEDELKFEKKLMEQMFQN